MSSRSLCLAVITFVVTLAIPQLATAQRGAAFVHQDQPAATALDGFPGMFDTNVVREKHVVVDSFLSVDYGVTSNLTVGAWLVPAIIAIDNGSVSFLLQSRYRLYSHDRMAATLSVVGGSFRSDTSKSTIALATTNVSYRFNRRHSVTATVMLARIDSTVFDDAMFGTDATQSLTGIATGVTYQLNVAKRLALQLTAVSLVFGTGTLDSSSATVNADISASSSILARTLLRPLASLRLGNFLLSGGALMVIEPFEPVPWLSLAWTR